MIRLISRALLLAVVAVALSGCQTLRGWFSMSDAPEIEPAELVEFNQTVPVRRVWSTDTGKGMSKSRPNLRPFRDNDRVWVGDHEGRLTAVNLESGRVEERHETELPLSAGPAVYDDLLLLGTFDGQLVAMDADSGSYHWRTQLSSEILSYPVLHDDVIIVRCIDGRVFGIDPDNGSRLWVYDRSVPLLTLRGNSDLLVRAGQVFIGYDDGLVAGLRVADGEVLWEQRVSEPEGRTELERLADIDGPMAIVGTELYTATYHGRMAGMALESGRIMWVKDVRSASGLSLRRTQLAASDDDDTVWLVDRRNGSTLWQDDRLARREITRPVFYGALVVTVDAEGYMHFHDSDDGEFVARERIGNDPPAGAPAVIGNLLVVLDSDGTLSAWRTGTSG